MAIDAPHLDGDLAPLAESLVDEPLDLDAPAALSWAGAAAGAATGAAQAPSNMLNTTSRLTIPYTCFLT